LSPEVFHEIRRRHVHVTRRRRALPVRSEEHVYRCGFEAAQWCDDRENVRPLHGNMIDEPAFRRGWERGHEYRRGRSLRKSA